MKWFLQLIWDPVAALDLTAADGKLDHGKVMGFFTYASMLAVLVLYVIGVGQLLPLGHTIALISTAYGWASWRVFLKARSSLSEQKQDQMVEMVKMGGGEALAFEPHQWAEGDPDEGVI